ncbi:ribonuclease H-like domain-containing protein [Bacillus kwashiorkori]|uniref:ribonuclease H-like domain-containing protein n=1 Tax=Bacillus kwashiorkori TaxID=1522318 RepID=UPI00078587E4|nr:ribonuclease H-like domain-containing protein [Bacillus kwashiorkori]
MNLKNKLAIYGSYVKKDKTIEENNTEERITIPYFEAWQEAGVRPYFLDNNYCLIKEKRYSIHEKRGLYHFSDFIRAMEAWQTTEQNHPLSAKGYKPTDLFFFDIETTGLGSGVGNTIFLLGYAFIEDDEIVIKQHLLPEPAGEIALYDSFLNSIDYTTLVTYNGKAFDWPQVKTRHTLIRDFVKKLPAFGHFDLFHAAKRLWKQELESVKLTNVEKHILKIEREDDVPGYLAPIIYFDFVESKRPDGILKVLDHNEDDLLSLITLYTHITFLLLQWNDAAGEEQFLVGNWYAYLNETNTAIEVLQEAAQNNDGYTKWKSMHKLAYQYKKQKNRQEALSLWLKVVSGTSGKIKIEACIEAAKIYEHQFKNIEKALHLTEIAQKEYDKYSHYKEQNKFAQLWEELDKRKKRLLRKLKVFPG